MTSIITIMTTAKVTDLRHNTTYVIRQVQSGNDPVIIMSRSEPQVVMMNMDTYREWKGSGMSQKNDKFKSIFDDENFYLTPKNPDEKVDVVRWINEDRSNNK